MKKTIVIILAIIASSCSFDNKEVLVVENIRLVDGANQCFISTNDSDLYFVDWCYKYKVGDTIKIVNQSTDGKQLERN